MCSAALFDRCRMCVIALHGLACSGCVMSELCASEVVTDLIQVLDGDPNPKVRHGAVLVTACVPRRLRRAGCRLSLTAGCKGRSIVGAAGGVWRRSRGQGCTMCAIGSARSGDERDQTLDVSRADWVRGRARSAGDRRRSARAGAGDHVGRAYTVATSVEEAELAPRRRAALHRQRRSGSAFLRVRRARESRRSSKSLGLFLVEREHRVAVLAVDPSSTRSGGRSSATRPGWRSSRDRPSRSFARRPLGDTRGRRAANTRGDAAVSGGRVRSRARRDGRCRPVGGEGRRDGRPVPRARGARRRRRAPGPEARDHGARRPRRREQGRR